MPKSVQIVRWRYRRHQKRQQGWHSLLNSCLVVGGVLTAVTLLLALTAVSASTLFYAYFTEQLPPFTDIPSLTAQEGQTAVIYAQSAPEKPAIPIYRVEKPTGTWLTINQIPPTAVASAVTYHQWEANDPRLVSQLIAQTFPAAADDDNLLAQIRRTLLTHRATNSYSHEQLIEWYLNTAYYGHLAYGLDSAAHVYFGKSAVDLNLAEIALLTAVADAPHLNPIDNLPAAKERQEQLLESLQQAALISLDELLAARFTPLQITPPLVDRFDVIAPHFALYARQALEAQFSPQAILYDGLQVYTSLDLDLQRQAECLTRAQINRLSGAIGSGLPADERDACPALDFLPPLDPADVGIDHNLNNGAVVVVDPQTAVIRAMVGSHNYNDTRRDGATNIATVGQRQPGSLLYPFIYLTALSQGYTPATMILDVPDADTPTDDPAIYRGPIRLRTALGNNYTNPAQQVAGWVGMGNALRTAVNLGLATLDPHTNPPNPTLLAEGGAVNLLDLAYSFAILDNMGVMVGQPAQPDRPDARPLDPVAILRVESPDGTPLYTYDPQEREIVRPQLAYLLNDMLSDRRARCESLGCPNILELPNNRPTAVALGNTANQQDVWTVGYTPQLVTAVWLGNHDRSGMDGMTAYKGSAPIWHALMSWALQDETVALWPRPADLVEIAVCNTSGLLATPYCPTISELFIPGTQPTTYDTIYQEFAINRENGRLATLDTPPDLIERQIFQILPAQAAEWAQSQAIPTPPTEYDTLRPRSTSGEAAVTHPPPFAFVRGTVPISGTAQSGTFDYYRLTYFPGLLPDRLQAITPDETTPQRNGRLGEWTTADLDGLYTLLLTVVRQDGSFAEISVPVTVDNTPPEVSLDVPTPNQSVSISDGWVIVRATASDNSGIQHIAYYVDDAEEPFIISHEPPYREVWRIREAGCFSFYAVAVDWAGNETVSTAVSICVE